jgi:hypothetical protein
MQRKFNKTIGKLDEILSRLMVYKRLAVKGELSEVNTKTLEHHAEDLIGCGTAIKAALQVAATKQALTDQMTDWAKRGFVKGTRLHARDIEFEYEFTLEPVRPIKVDKNGPIAQDLNMTPESPIPPNKSSAKTCEVGGENVMNHDFPQYAEFCLCGMFDHMGNRREIVPMPVKDYPHGARTPVDNINCPRCEQTLDMPPKGIVGDNIKYQDQVYHRCCYQELCDDLRAAGSCEVGRHVFVNGLDKPCQCGKIAQGRPVQDHGG